MRALMKRSLLVLFAGGLAACSSSESPSPPAPFSVGGTVAGLAGTGLVLQYNGGNDLPVTENGAFAFGTSVASGAAYAVTVLAQPTRPSQTCSVTGGTGTVGGSDVTGVVVTCVTNTYAIGGGVAGLAGTGLVLQNNGGNDLPVTENGAFAFGASVASGAAYAVTVLAQPTRPSQTCSVTGGTGTVGGSDVTGVVVTCVTNTYAIGGGVAGLAGTGLVLQNNGGNDLPVTENGAFAFGASVASGAAYAVTVLAQPTRPSQTCSVTGGTGTVGGSDVTGVVVTCVTNTYAIGGGVAGLAGTGLVLQNNGGNDLPVTENGAFAFGTSVASGAAYAVTVLAQPTRPSQTCSVTGGTGTVGGSDVTGVVVTCVTNTYAIGGGVAGLAGTGLVLQNNGGNDLPVTENGAFAFGASVASGAAYAVTVLAQPTRPSQTCSVTGGTGTVGGSDVTGVVVTCVTNTYAIGGGVAGLAGTGLVLQNNGGNDLPVTENGAFAFGASVASGAAYAVTVLAQPTRPSQTCSVTGGTGTVGGSDVTGVAVNCSAPAPIIQQWATPGSWGGDATGVWPDSSRNMIQHLTFNAAGPVETKLGAGGWTAPSGTPGIVSSTAIAYPQVTRYGAGPFGSAGSPLHYQWSGNSDALNLPGDMLVCAVVKPDWDPLVNETERVLVAKGKQEESGWVLMQMHGAYCFHYQYASGATAWVMLDTATHYTNEGIPDHGPLNTSFVVVCAGRDSARGRLVIAANSFEASAQFLSISPALSLLPTTRPASVGGYDDASPMHVFKGRVYEAAVWSEAANPVNVQAKMAPVLGTSLPDGSVASHVHNREAPFTGADGLYHTAWRHAPRIYPGKGFLFGLQGTNRIAHPEAFERWTASDPAVVVQANDLQPPNDSAIPSADRITLPPGSNLSLVLGSFSSPNFVEGQIWLRPVSAGTLRVRSDEPGTPRVTRGQQDVDLAALALGQWTRVAISSIRTGGGSVPAGTVYLENPGTTAIEFHAWGMALTQVARGNDIGFDPGLTVYDTLKNSDDFEALVLAPVPDTTVTTGFCLLAQAAPFDGMAWNAPFPLKRVAISWNGTVAGTGAQLYADATNVCLRVTSGATSQDTCGTASAGWAPGSSHTLKACMTPSGQATVYADGTLLRSADHAYVPDLKGGSVHLGAGDAGPWQGYISRAKVCRNSGVLADCD